MLCVRAKMFYSIAPDVIAGYMYKYYMYNDNQLEHLMYTWCQGASNSKQGIEAYST